MKKYLNNTVGDNLNYFEKEKDLYNVWKNFCHLSKYLTTAKLKGIETGELNELDGPDFQGAEFELDGKIYRGDVEIHKKCVDWKKHGHHLDQRYDRVVLHLVASKNLYSVQNSKNQNIPSISLLDLPMPASNFQCNFNCEEINQTIEPAIFQDLALKRMSNKSFEIYEHISSMGIDQALYSLILKSLGNVINKNNYERMAQLIPWKIIHLLKDKNNQPEFWIALFLGTAGLLNQQSDSILLKHWRTCLPLIEGTALNRENWKWGGIRPNNFPQKRLSGLAWFIWQLEKPSIFNSLENLFYKRYTVKKFIKELIVLFSCGNNNLINKNSWGKNQILELTGNVFIPLFYKIALNNNSFGFQLYLIQLYLELPSTQEYGKLKSLKSHLKFNSDFAKYFYCNQALLYLHTNYCFSNNFTNCPLQTIQQKN